MSELENGDTMTEEDYLRNIWKSLGVGKNGYIDITELERVCTHIGMEEMNDEVCLHSYYGNTNLDNSTVTGVGIVNAQ